APYTEQHLFYGDLQDMRSCTPCACDPPTGSVCTVVVSTYTDDVCASAPSYMLTVDSAGPPCHHLASASGGVLGSKSASAPTYTPGACAPSGGVPMGSAVPVDPTTFCCIPSP